MTKKKINRLLKIILPIAVVILGVYGIGIWQIRQLNASIEFPPAASDTLARFKLADDCTFKSITGSKVYFDMGSRHSFIQKESVEKLRSMNYPMKEIGVFVYTTDNNGHSKLFTKKVRLDVYFPNPAMPDSKYILRDVDLLVSDDVNGNLIGMDILRHMVLEHINDANEIRLYRSVPPGYTEVCDIDINNSVWNGMCSTNRRASIELVVNDEAPTEYFFDTGGDMRRFDLVQPLDMLSGATSAVSVDSLTGLMVQGHCRVSFGNRLKYSSVVYADTLHTDKYSVNPLKLFDQDIVIDFPGEKLYTRNARQ